MRYEMVKDYEIESLKREISKSLSSGDTSAKSASGVKRQIDSAVRELKRALSSLERNTDSRMREFQQSASSSSRSYSSYSSCESGIRDARREIERAISKIDDQLRSIPESSSYGYGYSSGDAGRKLDRLVEALKRANSELQSVNRRIDELAKENQELKKKKTELQSSNRHVEEIDRENQKLRRKVGSLDSDVARMAAGAALAAATSRQEIRRAQRDNEQVVAELKRGYEREIEMLKSTLSQKASENAELSAKIAARDGLDDDNWEPTVSGLTIAEDYAVLWNNILEDDIIELREVRHIQKWLSKSKIESQEAFELAQCCEEIIARGEVLGSDAQRLYDCSFKLLGALGAKLEQ